MLRPYVAVLRRPTLARLLGSALVWGLGAAAFPLALLLFARESTGSFASAGAVVAAAMVAAALLGPLRARLADRAGASRVLPLLATASATAVAGLVVAGRAGAGTLVLAAAAALATGTGAPIVPVLRALLSEALPAEAERKRAYALLTLLQESSFVIGPAVASLVATASATVAVGATTALMLTGTIAFATSPGARAARPPRERVSTGALTGGLRTLVGISVLLGVAFGALDVALPAFAEGAGARAASGLLLSALALGISAGGLVFGAVPARRRAGQLMAPLAAVAAVALLPLPAARSLAVLGLLVVVGGIALGPLLTCELNAMDEVALPGTGAEATAWTISAFAVGSAGGAAAAGQLVDAVGRAAGLALPAPALALAAALALVRPLRPLAADQR